EEAQTVTYVYKPVEEEPTPAAPVTVKYVDEDGNPLADAEELNGNIGESYKTTPKEIDGYKRVKVVGKETGEFGEDRQTVTYIYEKINVSNPDKGKDVGSKPSVSDGQKLPDTATDSYNVIVLGLILLISGMILGFVYYRRQKLS
ncbi:MucBP domain-containing protein, partial [Sediminibacillus halophilus]